MKPFFYGFNCKAANYPDSGSEVIRELSLTLNVGIICNKI